MLQGEFEFFMAINFDLVIDVPDDSVDMKAGLDSMQGVSDAVRCIAESVLTEKVPERMSSKSNVRTSLKRSFRGSYGHIFSLDLYDEGLKKKLNGIGRPAFVELIGYFISESLYRDSGQLSAKAQRTLNKLGDTANKIVKQLRVSSLENIHEISTKFNHDIKIRHRISRDEQSLIAYFDSNSAVVFQAEQSGDEVDLNVVVTRLNIHTGNGRFQIEGEDETVAFGFGGGYKEVDVGVKKLFSENLDYNNGIEREAWKCLKIVAFPVKLKDGRVVKYIVKDLHED